MIQGITDGQVKTVLDDLEKFMPQNVRKLINWEQTRNEKNFGEYVVQSSDKHDRDSENDESRVEQSKVSCQWSTSKNKSRAQQRNLWHELRRILFKDLKNRFWESSKFLSLRLWGRKERRARQPYAHARAKVKRMKVGKSKKICVEDLYRFS